MHLKTVRCCFWVEMLWGTNKNLPTAKEAQNIQEYEQADFPCLLSQERESLGNTSIAITEGLVFELFYSTDKSIL